MAYVLCTSECYGCKRIFSYNPIRVPSIRIKGVREPVCRDCVESVINPQRAKDGLEPFVPAPDAYEACDESELD